MTHEESGIVIEEAPNLTLYTSPGIWVHRHVLPVRISCPRCKTVMSVTDIGDIHHRSVETVSAEAKEEYTRAWAQYVLYSSLYPQPPKAEVTVWTDELCVTCRVCAERLNVTPMLTGKAVDAAPIVAYFKGREGLAHRRSGRRAIPWVWIRSIVLAVSIVVSVANVVFWTNMVVAVVVIVVVAGLLASRFLGGESG